MLKSVHLGVGEISRFCFKLQDKNNMKTFIIFQHATRGYQSVKVGYCWPAFYFDFLWAIVSRMWAVAAILFGLSVFLAVSWAVVSGYIPPEMSPWLVNISSWFPEPPVPSTIHVIPSLIHVLWALLLLFVGLQGNEWRAKNLMNRGYEEVGVVQAGNKNAAIALHIKNSKK